jgi:hypothetical protein
MRNLMCACLLLFAGRAAPVSAQGDKVQRFFDPLPSKLRAVKTLSNHDRGFGGSNDFYLLSKEFLGKHTEKEFKLMLRDRNPVVRAMGLLCLAEVDAREHYLILLYHTKDKEEVYLHEGCVVSKITVGEFARWLLNNPRFLDPDGKRPAV